MKHDADRIAGHISGGESPVRYLSSSDHRRWTVREIASNRYDRRDARSGEARDLAFIAPDIVRRIRHYPSDWYMLDDEALYALSLRR